LTELGNTKKKHDKFTDNYVLYFESSNGDRKTTI